MTTSQKTLAGKYRGLRTLCPPLLQRVHYSFKKIVRFCRESLAETISVKSNSGEKKMGQEKEDFEPDAAAPPTNGEANE